MIRAAFLAGARLEDDNPEILLQFLSRYYKFPSVSQQEIFVTEISRKAL